MRVGLIVEQLLAPVPGGTGRYARELGRALVESAAPGDDVQTFTAWHSSLQEARIAGAIGPRRLRLPASVLARLWQRGYPPQVRTPDVLHAPTPFTPTGRSARPLVVTVHDAVPWTHPETLTAHGAQWHRDIITAAVLAGAHLVTPTRVVAEELTTVLTGLSADRVHPLGGGVSADLLVTDSPAHSAALLQRLGVPDRFLLTVATLEPRKGLNVAIRALAALGPGAVPLVVAGQPGWGDLDPVAVAAAAGLAPESLLLLGKVGDAELRVLLRSAQALVMPSLAEGFGLPAAEAMALGTPVLCSDLPVLNEVTGGAALTFQPGDADGLAQVIEAVLTGPAMADGLRARGLAEARRHSWPAVAQGCWELYRSLLG